jgi:hypothetical protein
MKINFFKIVKNFFNILKPFSDKSPDWGVRWKYEKKKKFPMGYSNRSPPGLDPNTPWYTE